MKANIPFVPMVHPMGLDAAFIDGQVLKDEQGARVAEGLDEDSWNCRKFFKKGGENPKGHPKGQQNHAPC